MSKSLPTKDLEMCLEEARYEECLNNLSSWCYATSFNAGWWVDAKTEEAQTHTNYLKYIVTTKLMLIVSEISEAMEAYRKGARDDKLPERTGLEVELADALIRIFDLAGALELDLGGALAEKMQYNRSRDDHKISARNAEGGKRF